MIYKLFHTGNKVIPSNKIAKDAMHIYLCSSNFKKYKEIMTIARKIIAFKLLILNFLCSFPFKGLLGLSTGAYNKISKVVITKQQVMI